MKKLCFGLSVICLGGLTPLALGADLLSLPMNAQISGAGGNVLDCANAPCTITFEPAASPAYAQMNINASQWYYGPYIRWFRAAPTLPRVIDISTVGCAANGAEVVMSADMRYYQPGRYGDASIFVRFYNVDGSNNPIAFRDYGMIYNTNAGDAPYPTWTHKMVYLNDSAKTAYSEGPVVTGGVFDPTQVGYMRFYGTDWSWISGDFIDVRNFTITADPAVLPNITAPETTYVTQPYTRQFTTNFCTTATTWTLSGNPTGMAIDNTGKLTYTPPTGELNHSYTITVGAGNGTVNASRTFTLTVVAQPPAIIPIPNCTVMAGSEYLQQVGLSAGVPQPTFTMTGPTGAAITSTGGIHGWTPSAGDVGNPFNFSVTATNVGGSDNKTWTVTVVAAVAGDNVAAPWGTANGNISGTQSSSDAKMVLSGNWGVYPDPASNAAVDWTLDTKSNGADRPSGNQGRGQITFDEAGNLYWKTAFISGQTHVASVDPTTHAVRWVSPAIGGEDTTSVVVDDLGPTGKVYVLTGTGIAAFKKSDGTQVWATDLPNCGYPLNGDKLTPVLYNGKLYAFGSIAPRYLYQVNAITGVCEYASEIPLTIGNNAWSGPLGQMTLVPNSFGAGTHGLYFVTDGGNGGDGMYGIAVSAAGATLQWSGPAPKVAKSHVIYVDSAQRVCVAGWDDYGPGIECWNLDGTLGGSEDIAPGGKHGFQDLTALDPKNGTDILAGSFDGRIGRYQGITHPSDPSAYAADVVYDSGGFEALANGNIVGQDNWADDTDDATLMGQVQIVDDPTGSGRGKVMSLAPLQDLNETGGWHWLGCYRPVTQTKQLLTFEFDEYRSDTDIDFYLADNFAWNGWWVMSWDNGGGALGVTGNSNGGPPTVSIKTGVWQHVKYSWNYPAPGKITLQLGTQLVVGDLNDDDNVFEHFDVEVVPSRSKAPTYIDNLVVKQGDLPPSIIPPFTAGPSWYQMNQGYGELGAIGGVFANEDAKSVALTYTGSGAGSVQVVGFNVTDSTMYTVAPPQPEEPVMFLYDTGGTDRVYGGPLLGPAVAGTKQHVYFFKSDGTLVALTHATPIPGDLNRDGKVDIADLDLLFCGCAASSCQTGTVGGGTFPTCTPSCNAGSGIDIPANCAASDLDGNGSVDQDDFGMFQRCYSGTAPGDPNCGN